MRLRGKHGGGEVARAARTILLAVFLVVPVAPPVLAQTFQEPDAFLAETFSQSVPEPQLLDITPEMQRDIGRILRRSYRAQRLRYWRDGARTVWILEEIGRYRPITVGLVISGGAIDTIRVLIYRESHGWEVRHDFFTNQFKGLTLDEQSNLSGRIDGISGATLSVNALRNLARFALYLDRAVRTSG
jgi:FMN-binding protein